MTIVKEEKFTIRDEKDIKFDVLKRMVLDAIEKDKRYSEEDEEKKRVIRSASSYQEFKDLVSTVDLVPVKRRAKLSMPTIN
jgi:hypothetical protein